jgi:DNA-binding transcriptional LysR family regulator
LLRDADEAEEAVKLYAEGRTGRVRLGTSTGVVVHLLPQVLQAMGHQYPGIDVEVSILGSSQAMAKLQEGKLDIGLVATPQPATKGISISHWRSDPMMAYLPSAWKAPATITPQWLAEQPLIFNEPTTHMYQLTMEWFAAGGCSPRARLELNYTEAMKSLVVAGYGAAVLPWELPERPEANPGLSVVPLRPKLMRHIGIAHRPLDMLDAASRNLLDTLAKFRQAPKKGAA